MTKMIEDRREPPEDERKLDAYGHMTWTVGNEDWVACLDAIRISATEIAYHVVVDCESGGFCWDTEKGTVPATEDGIKQLLGLPGSLRPTGPCFENYPTEDDVAEHGKCEWEDCEKSWSKHLRSLLTDPWDDGGADDYNDGAEEAAWYEELNRGYARDRI